MKRKKFLLILPLTILTLASCNPGDSSVTSSPTSTTPPDSSVTSSIEDDSSVSSSVEPVELTAADVVDLLEALAEAEVNGYSYLDRAYSDNYITGQIYTNYLEVIEFEVHEDGFDSVLTVYDDLDRVTATSTDTYDVGRYASYVLNDNYCLRGVQGINDSTDYIEYYENNMYVDLERTALEGLTSIVSIVLSAVATPDDMWSSAYGYTVEEFTTTLNDAGNIVCEVTYSAEEEGYYAKESGGISVEVTPDGQEIVSISYTSCTFDMGDTSDDPDVGANSYYHYEVSDISYGAPLTTEVEPFDFTTINPDRIYNAPNSVVENVPEGDLDEDAVIKILDSIEAYTTNTVSATVESYVSSYYDYTTWEDYGPAVLTETYNRYQDNLMIKESTYAFEDETRADITTKTQYHALAEGIEVATENGGEVSRYIVDAAYVSSLDTYLSACAFKGNLAVTEAFDYVASNGFVSQEGSWGNYDAYLKSATKTGETIVINYVYFCEFPGVYSNTYDIVINIEDNFVTSVTFDDEEGGTFYHYILEQGEYPEFTGELI